MDAPKDERTVRAGQAIRAAREAKGLTQPVFSDLLREALQKRAAPGDEPTVGQSAISRWEKGVNAPEHWKWRVIEDVLGMEAGTLATIFLAGEPPSTTQLEQRLEAIEARLTDQDSTMAEILRAIKAADRRLRDQGT